MQGTVFSGSKAATKIMKDYLDKFKALFGKSFLPGTLNLRLGKELDISKWKYIKGFTKPDGTKRGGVYYKEGKLNSLDVIFLYPKLSKHKKNVLEAISDKNLRKTLKLKDRDSVIISI